jgi:hypothetical protein
MEKKKSNRFWYLIPLALFIISYSSLLLYNGKIIISISPLIPEESSVPVELSNAPFPGPEKIELIRYSMLQIYFEIADADKIIESGRGHGCIYSHRGDYSYLILPKHCFPYDSTKQCTVWARDYEGKKIDLDWVRMYRNSTYDAEMLKVEKIFGLPSLCETAMLTGYRASGDSALIFSPFNVRNVEKKRGIFLSEERVKMSTIISEFGDSGGLVMSREGVAGILVSSSGNGSTMYYVPILVFEKMYGGFMYDD